MQDIIPRCIECTTPAGGVGVGGYTPSAGPESRCGGLVKPDIVFFGENLPQVSGAGSILLRLPMPSSYFLLLLVSPARV